MTIFTRLKQYCLKANKGQSNMEDKHIEYFGELCKQAMKKQFQEPKRGFQIRMSQIGKDIREQQAELLGLPKDEEDEYNLVLKFLYGDVCEAIVMTLLHASGVNVEDEQKVVKREVAGITLEGTYDVKINGKIYDVKSCSPYAFSNKFGLGFDNVEKTDTFGYVTQLYEYAESDKGSTVGGWVVLNKVDGQILVVEPPPTNEKYRIKHTTITEKNIKTLQETKSIDDINKDLTFIPETFYSKPTGRMTLPEDMKYFSYKKILFGDQIELKPNPSSKAKNRPLVWYKKGK